MHTSCSIELKINGSRSRTQLATIGVLANYDLAPDGKRLVPIMAPEGPTPRENPSHIMALNFFAEVRRRLSESGR
jgi:hypothetical protein